MSRENWVHINVTGLHNAFRFKWCDKSDSTLQCDKLLPTAYKNGRIYAKHGYIMICGA